MAAALTLAGNSLFSSSFAAVLRRVELCRSWANCDAALVVAELDELVTAVSMAVLEVTAKVVVQL